MIISRRIEPKAIPLNIAVFQEVPTTQLNSVVRIAEAKTISISSPMITRNIAWTGMAMTSPT